MNHTSKHQELLREAERGRLFNKVIEWVQTHAWYPVMNDQKQFADASGDAVIISLGPDGELAFCPQARWRRLSGFDQL